VYVFKRKTFVNFETDSADIDYYRPIVCEKSNSWKHRRTGQVFLAQKLKTFFPQRPKNCYDFGHFISLDGTIPFSSFNKYKIYKLFFHFWLLASERKI